MTQLFVETSMGQNEGQNDDDKVIVSKESEMSLWIKQNNLPDTIAHILQENEIFSLQDLTIFESEQEIKEFVNSLGLKYVTKKKFISAIQRLMKQNTNKQNELQSSSKANNNEKKQNIPLSNDDQKQPLQQKQIEWKSVEISSSTQKISIESNKNEDIKIQQTDKHKQEKMSEYRRNVFGYWEDGYFNGIRKEIKNAGTIWAGIGGILGTVIPILPVWYAMEKTQQNKIDKNVSNKKECNIDITEFNSYLKEIKDFETLILSKRNKLKEQENKLNSYSFSLERVLDINNKSKVIVVIGPTGFGKSLICNRLLGNKQDIDHIEDDYKNCEFKVAITGNVESETTKLLKKEKIVIINDNNNNNNIEKKSFMLSVIDTPGAFDSQGNDDQYNNLMSHYFAACGGINIFCIFFKFNATMDSQYKQLLILYQKFWGINIWKHCVVFITHCDMANISEKKKKKIENGLIKTKQQIKIYLESVSNGKCKNIPMYVFGEQNFEQSTMNFLSSLTDENNPFFDKYQCKNIQSPINLLYKELKEMVEKHKILSSKLEAKHKLISKKKDKIWDD